MKNWKCRLLGHKWDMFAGFEQLRVHSQAKCKRCGVRYEENEGSV